MPLSPSALLPAQLQVHGHAMILYQCGTHEDELLATV